MLKRGLFVQINPSYFFELFRGF